MKDYRAIYRQLNESYTRRLVFRIGIDAGFFTEIRYMAMAMLWCLEHKVRFELYSDGANFASSSNSEGWREFFEPFCPEVHEAWHKLLNRRAIPSVREMRRRMGKVQVSSWSMWKWYVKVNALRIYGRVRGRGAMLSQDVPASVAEHYCIPELDIDGDWLEGLCRMIDVVWHPTCLVPFDVPQRYAGCQLRGGDKVTEVDLISPADVVRTLPDDLQDVVVLSDDYDLLESVRLQFPDKRFYSLCTPEERGYVHQQFAKQSGEEKHARMSRFITTMDTLFRAECFAGSVTPAPALVLLAWHWRHGGAFPVDWPADDVPRVLRLPVNQRGRGIMKNEK